ncbi:MAG: right-handed parallel beta-helix repeat-containing protein, partial [Candidatus Heimdallarchaeota archaeon]|nr:right-handed parallel beta-helix repeat-containing protein [Candidatus Heimdallarchaeota archaeon]MCK4254232.1 right-handed parallel beta-helix repeat-containing protein [Candidatus Heimdallarchaeota archaeon]
MSIALSFNLVNTSTVEPSFDSEVYIPNDQDYNKRAYVERTDPINIVNNDSLASFSTSGDGSEGDPYIISNYNVTTTDDYAIRVTGTTLHFVIRDNYFDGGLYGIRITGIVAGTAKVINNTCMNNANHGMYISSMNTTIDENICTNNGDHGILLWSSGYSNITSNIC